MKIINNYQLKEIDLRSDTVTLPTDEMREAMNNAEVGDDVYQEDPTVNRLEELAAKKLGKETALFVPSGTMGNLIAVLTHCQRGDEVILEMDSHIYYYEVGGMSAVAGVIPRLITGDKGILNPQDIKRALREENLHYPKATLLCLENTHNRAGGTIVPLEVIEEICQLAHQRNIQVHLDGARIFNAAIALNIEPALLTKNVDSVMFCLSKGLSAPVGSILAGSKEFIQRSRKNRKMLGGGMRQAGILAAAGIIAIENMVERLEEDHKNARILGEGLADIGGIKVDLETVQTNMVYLDLNKSGMDTYQFLPKLAEYNILGSPRPPTKVRLVTHYGISEEDIYTTIKAIKEIVKN
ncbi:MAG: low-specificity L-threonine aldolase [Candidatus Caldatribacteriota bacterium]|nr:low-specificity L-threonine aldolase [Candidatus Caldatribacteriota bacterium]